MTPQEINDENNNPNNLFQGKFLCYNCYQIYRTWILTFIAFAILQQILK